MLFNLKDNYFIRLLKADKAFFVLVCIWIIGTLFFARRQSEEFPFLLYGLYSLKVPVQTNFTAYSITLAGQEIKYIKLRDSQEELISSTLENAVPLIESGKLTKEEELKYKKWLLDFCNDIRLSGDNKMDVYRLTCRYGEGGKAEVFKKDLILSYAAGE